MRDIDFNLIGRNIKDRRKELGFTQEYVADILDVNPSHISNVERGFAKPSLTMLISLANVLSCSVDVFISHEYDYKKEKPLSDELDKMLSKKIKLCSYEKKQRLLKIIDLI